MDNGRHVYLSVARAGADVLLRLSPDEERAARALAHLGPYALAHLDLAPDPSLREGLSRIARACAASGRELDEDVAIEALSALIARELPGAEVTVRARVPVGQVVPRWPVAIRSGAPDPGAGRLWPYDAELAGMRLGRRRLVLREWVDADGAESDAAWLEAAGLRARVVEPSGRVGERRVVLAAREEAILDEAEARDRAVNSTGAAWAEAARWMGEALGYPRCCVERYVRVRTRDDVAMFVDHLPPIGAGPATPLLCWIEGAVQLVSFAPCSLACPAARALAAALLVEMEGRYAGFAALWERHARGLHAIAADGRSYVMRVDGVLGAEEGARVTQAIELLPPHIGDDVPEVRAAMQLEGARLAIRRQALVDEERGLVFALAADHRAAP